MAASFSRVRPSSSASMPRATTAKASSSRRYVSQAKCSPARCASRSTTGSVRPRLRIVSIIPGIETGAPERTETSSGRAGSPNPRSASPSSVESAASISARRSSGISPPSSCWSAQAGVAMVNPGGTGRSSVYMLASPDPLPPSRSRLFAPESNGYTHRGAAMHSPFHQCDPEHCRGCPVSRERRSRRRVG